MFSIFFHFAKLSTKLNHVSRQKRYNSVGVLVDGLSNVVVHFLPFFQLYYICNTAPTLNLFCVHYHIAPINSGRRRVRVLNSYTNRSSSKPSVNVCFEKYLRVFEEETCTTTDLESTTDSVEVAY